MTLVYSLHAASVELARICKRAESIPASLCNLAESIPGLPYRLQIRALYKVQ
jgi:hypothetical protein